MLKTAYQLGVQRALDEAGLTKEALSLSGIGSSIGSGLRRAGSAIAAHPWLTLGGASIGAGGLYGGFRKLGPDESRAGAVARGMLGLGLLAPMLGADVENSYNRYKHYGYYW